MKAPPPAPSSAAPSLYEVLGGRDPLCAIITAFIDRVRQDVMIGFLFQHVDAERLKRMEFEFAASHLGGPEPYTGRPLHLAHAKHPIMGGHFMRRLQILKEVLQHFDVPEPVRQHWVEHTLRLRASITRDQTDECRGNPLPIATIPKNSPPRAQVVKLRRT